MYPFLPHAGALLWKMLTEENERLREINDAEWSAKSSELPIEFKMGKPEPLFKKIEIGDKIKSEKEKIKKSDLKEKEPEIIEDGVVDMIKMTDFQKLNLRIGQVIKIEDHPDADKLYVLQVDFGTEQRQLVAGLKTYYKKEEILNKKIVVIVNLEPAKLRGVESNGMLLAADDGKGNVSLLVPDKDVGLGARVK
jgi:methionyl-tRNA synthetase